MLVTGRNDENVPSRRLEVSYGSVFFRPRREKQERTPSETAPAPLHAPSAQPFRTPPLGLLPFPRWVTKSEGDILSYNNVFTNLRVKGRRKDFQNSREVAIDHNADHTVLN